MGNYKKICIYDPKKKVWINTLNGMQVSERTAHRYNTRYIRLRTGYTYKKKGRKVTVKPKRASEITLNELYGNTYDYKIGKSITEQSEKVHDILYRERQIVKVTTISGKTKYYSPYYKKFIRKPSIPLKTTIVGVPMLLYRMDRERTRMYHIIKWDLGHFVMSSPQDVDRYKNLILPKFDRMLSEIPKKLKTYSFGSWHGKKRVVYIRGGVKYIFQKHGVLKSSGRNWAQTRANNMSYVRKQFVRMLEDIKKDFKDGYTQITIASVYLYLFTFSIKEDEIMYGFRTGVRDL